MNSIRISYATRADTSPEEERNALKNVYKLVIDSAKRNAAGAVSTNGGDATERFKDDSSATRNYTS